MALKCEFLPSPLLHMHCHCERGVIFYSSAAAVDIIGEPRIQGPRDIPDIADKLAIETWHFVLGVDDNLLFCFLFDGIQDD